MSANRSWKMEIRTEGKNWASNACAYATEEEAKLAGDELLSRWYVPDASRAVPSMEPVNYRFDKTAYKPVPLTEVEKAQECLDWTRRNLVQDAADAQEVFSEDELEQAASAGGDNAMSDRTTIYKYPIKITDEQLIEVPMEHEFIHVGLDPQGTPCLWAMVYLPSQTTRVAVRVCGTGNPVPRHLCPENRVGTFNHGPFVWHVFVEGHGV